MPDLILLDGCGLVGTGVGSRGTPRPCLSLKKKKKKSPDLWAWTDGSLSVRAVEVEAEEAFGARLQSHMTYGGWGRVDN